MDDRLSYRPSRVQLFTVRVWAEHLDVGRVEWRGKVQHVLTGEVLYFRSWQQLIDQLRVHSINNSDFDCTLCATILP